MPIVKVTPEMVAQAEKDIDWAAIDAMSDADIARQVAENPDAAPLLNRAQTAASLVRYVRSKLHLSQAAFAARYHIPMATLQDWEQGRRSPDRPTMAYLRVINREPDVTARALSAGA